MSTKTKLKPRPIRKAPEQNNNKEVVKSQSPQAAALPNPSMPVVITEQRRNIKELTLFEVGLLPFLYLEAAVKYVFNYINKRYPLK